MVDYVVDGVIGEVGVGEFIFIGLWDVWAFGVVWSGELNFEFAPCDLGVDDGAFDGVFVVSCESPADVGYLLCIVCVGLEFDVFGELSLELLLDMV